MYGAAIIIGEGPFAFWYIELALDDSIVEGILALHDADLRNLYDLKVSTRAYPCRLRKLIAWQIFVQCDSDLMLARRIRRDVTERGRSLDGILEQ